MIPHYKLSSEDSNAIRKDDREYLTQLRNDIRAWIFNEENVSATAWQIQGLLIYPDQLGPTPLSSKAPMSNETSRVMHMIEWIAYCLGECVTFPGMKQSSQNVQQVFPVPGFEDRQSAASSSTTLKWHTEHADKDNPPDFLVIACLRNLDGIGTRLSRPNLNGLSLQDLSTLMQSSEFKFETNREHSRAMSVIDDDGLRYDPVYCTPTSDISRNAFHNLTVEIEEKALIVPQEPGSAVIIPNRSTVHARESFQARYDGTDRWLMRAMIRKI